MKILGIPVRLHWSFLILLGAIVAGSLAPGGEDLTKQFCIVVVLFGSVLLHEFGHALMARRFGISTSSITLYPIGGIARLERIPRVAKQELLIALAGPAVNVAIGIACLAIKLAFGHVHGVNFVLAVNAVLFLFNMLPAFPMDGGRVLRSLLFMRLSYEKATLIAVRTAQFFATLFIAWGIMHDLFLIFIGIMVMLASQGELYAVRNKPGDQQDGKTDA